MQQKLKIKTLAFILLLNAVQPVFAEDQPQAAAYNVTLITDQAPDFTDIDSYLRSITSQHAEPQQKAIALWRWSQRLRKQTSFPTEDGHEVLDPIFFFTSYGYTMCGIISGIDNSLWLNMGWKARYIQLGDHTVCENSWDGGKTWHMFDNSTSFFCFNDKGEVASVREIEQTPRFYLQNFSPEIGTNPVKDINDHQGWRTGADHPVEHGRTLANGVDSYKAPNDIIEDHLATRWGRRYVLNLRPGEHYTRYFSNLDSEKADARFYRPLRGKDVQGTRDKNIRASGVWRYAPNLADASTRAHVFSESGVSWTKEGVKGPGSVIFKVSAANVVTSAKLSIKATDAKVSVSRSAGIQWEPVALSGGEAELLDAVAGGTEYLVKVELEGAAAQLSSLAVETFTQLNRSALPRLARGPNQVQLRLGAQVDTVTLVPGLLGGSHKKTVFEEKSIAVNPKPYFNVPTLCPAVKNEPTYATWKIEVPTPIADVTYGANVCVRSAGSSVALLHSWDGKTFNEAFRKSETALPYDLVVNKSVDQVPDGAREVYLRYQFQTGGDVEKQWSMPGIQTALMTVRHKPRVSGFTPLEVTYCWVEHRESGDVERSHTQLITSPAAQYTINVGGYRDPTMKYVRINLKGHGPEGDKVKLGYSDGQDAVSASRPTWAKYEWGKNLALGKTYTLEGKQDEKNRDAGKDLTDGIIMPPDTYVSVKWMPTNVMFAKDVSPVATIDLGEAQSVAAVRVSAGQESGFRLTYPDLITVETSIDGKTFAAAGTAAFNQVFDPPADFVPGECEGSTIFDSLPAGGRLAYAYRILFEKPVNARYVRVSCACRKDWGVLLSEIQVFDTVKVDTQVPPLIVLPPLPQK